MSDPVINVEIEDVLASIRRLVSEGESPRSVVAAQQAGSPDKKWREAPVSVDVSSAANRVKVANRLILSPDLRVDTQPETPQSTSLEWPLPKPAPVPDAPLLLTTKESIPAPTARSPVDELILLSKRKIEPKPKVEAPKPAPETATHENADEDPNAPLILSNRMMPKRPSGEEARSKLLSTIAELEAAVTSQTDDFEPDGSEINPVVDWSETTANGAIFRSRAATTRISDVTETVSPDVIANAPQITPEIVAPEAHSSIAAAKGEPELKRVFAPTAPVETANPLPNSAPFGGPAFAMPRNSEALLPDSSPAEGMEVSDLVENPDNAISAPDLPGVADELSAYMQNGSAIDEEMLREVVSDIVRAELRGALGERITRNVRKLVRREIYRVLSSEEFN